MPIKELIHIHNQGPDLMVNSREVAKFFDVTHKHLRELAEDNRPYLEQLGQLRFQTEPGKLRPQGGGSPEKFVNLNFDQVAFLLTLTKPREDTKDTKLKLIIAFRSARTRLRPIDNVLLTIPDAWRKVFEDDFYIGLLGLYGYDYDASKNKPQWVGNFTTEFIYRPLYEELPEELRRKRQLHAWEMGTSEWRKLHQFIEQHAKEKLKKHINKVTGILESSFTRQDFFERFRQMVYGNAQLLLGSSEDNPNEFSIDKAKFFNALKKASQPVEKPPKKTSGPKNDAD